MPMSDSRDAPRYTSDLSGFCSVDDVTQRDLYRFKSESRWQIATRRILKVARQVLPTSPLLILAIANLILLTTSFHTPAILFSRPRLVNLRMSNRSRFQVERPFSQPSGAPKTSVHSLFLSLSSRCRFLDALLSRQFGLILSPHLMDLPTHLFARRFLCPNIPLRNTEFSIETIPESPGIRSFCPRASRTCKDLWRDLWH